jgi:FkbM family methyltransferase
LSYQRRQKALRVVRPTADWLLSAFGPHAFAKWQQATEMLLNSRHTQVSRLGRSLMTVPTPPGHYIPISFDGVAFKYTGSALDDLSYLARFHLMPWEVVTRMLWSDMCRSSNFVVDVGASTGTYSMTARASNNCLKVLAVEPNPRMIRLLLANLDLNGWLDRCCVLGVAASDETDLVELGLNDPSGGAGLVSLEHPLTGHGEALVAKMQIAPLVKGAQIIKLDVEGYEPTVLAGMADVLDQNRPTLICEALTETDLHRQEATLAPFGYDQPMPVSQRYSYTGDSRNFVWAHRENIATVSEALDKARIRAEVHLVKWRRLFPDVTG